MPASVLHVEDKPEATATIAEAVRGQNLGFIEVASTGSAWRFGDPDGPDIGLALLDQKLPVDDGGSGWATDDEVYELACRIAHRAPILWITANDVSARQMEIANCRGRIQKAGDVATKVEAHLEEVFDDLQPEIVLDEVLIELSELRPSEVTARVVTWRPDERFRIPLNRLEPWIPTVLRDSPGGAAYFRARAWLGAERPAQLDLIEWLPIAHATAAEEGFWSDL